MATASDRGRCRGIVREWVRMADYFADIALSLITLSCHLISSICRRWWRHQLGYVAQASQCEGDRARRR